MTDPSTPSLDQHADDECVECGRIQEDGERCTCAYCSDCGYYYMDCQCSEREAYADDDECADEV